MNKLLLSQKLLAASLVLASCCTSASAMEKSTYLGGLVGANFANNDSNSSTNTNFGITAGAKLDPSGNVGLGFYGTYVGQNNSGSAFGLPVGTSTRTYNLCGEMNVFASVFHFGGDAGAGINTWDANAGNSSVGTSKTAFIYGPEAGFDIPLGSSSLSIGGEVHYLFSNADGAPNNLQALGALKVWL